MPATTPTVDDFLAAVPAEQRAALEDLRQKIRAAAPDATESINYGVPAFKLNGRPLVSLGAAKNHCAFYVQSPAVMEAHAQDLKGYETTKGSVHFSGQTNLRRPGHEAREGTHRRDRKARVQVTRLLAARGT